MKADVLQHSPPASRPRRPFDGSAEIQPPSPAVVRWVQQSLGLLFNERTVLSGSIDPPTRNAIRRFQQSQGLVPDGLLRQQTITALIVARAHAREHEPRYFKATGPSGQLHVLMRLDRFEPGQADLSARHADQLARLAHRLWARNAAGGPIENLSIVGHTAASRGVSQDPMLGLRRATVVRDHLIVELDRLAYGLSRRIVIACTTRGASEPVAGPAACSRRVDIMARPAPPLPSPASARNPMR